MDFREDRRVKAIKKLHKTTKTHNPNFNLLPSKQASYRYLQNLQLDNLREALGVPR